MSFKTNFEVSNELPIGLKMTNHRRVGVTPYEYILQ